jgi:hypothetical protein
MLVLADLKNIPSLIRWFLDVRFFVGKLRRGSERALDALGCFFG